MFYATKNKYACNYCNTVTMVIAICAAKLFAGIVCSNIACNQYGFRSKNPQKILQKSVTDLNA
jgi:hypothetical protein